MMFNKNNCLILAPMAGITDPVFRLLCKEGGADVVLTEMVSIDGIVRNAEPTLRLIRFEPSERPIGVQLFGSDPEKFKKAACFIAERFQPDFLDLNSGCPVSKVVRKNGGAALLKDINRFAEIVTAIVRATDIPVTIKLRSGWHKHQWVDVEFAKCAESCGAAAITLHPRSQTMGFSGHSFWERIAIVKESVTIPVIGNGDVKNGSDAVSMKTQTQCDGIMIGRGACGNPWIFSQIRAALKGEEYSGPSTSQRRETALKHLALFSDKYGSQCAVREMKKHISWYIKGINGAAYLRDRIFRAETTDELRAAVQEAFEK